MILMHACLPALAAWQSARPDPRGGWQRVRGHYYTGGVSELRDHLARVQEIVDRARAFRSDEGADPKAFSRSVVEDLGDLAEAVAELLRRTGA